MAGIKNYIHQLPTRAVAYVKRTFLYETLARIDARTSDTQQQTSYTQQQTSHTQRQLEEVSLCLDALAEARRLQASHLENQLSDLLTLTRTIEERTRNHETQLNQLQKGLHVQHARSAANENRLHDLSVLLQTTEERSRTLTKQLADCLTLLHTTEQRSRTLQFQGNQALAESSYQIDMQRKWYLESMPAVLKLDEMPAASAVAAIVIETAHPIALMSNDHLEPDSTTEGLVRPTQFVRHCIDVLGADIGCLELGAGAAGLLFEYIQNGLVAIGIDGSDYCRKNRIGYWPLIPKNLFTCDLTYPFRLVDTTTAETVKFQLITAWEVFEHIAEIDLDQTIRNVATHLAPGGYFLGSISLLEYCDRNGRPYHVTLQPRSWWKAKFEENGLCMVDNHPFNLRLFCRGNGPRFQDFHNYIDHPEDGFHFVARLLSADKVVS